MEQQPTRAKQRPRRRLRARILPILGYVIVVFGLAWFLELRMPTTVIFVRHADTDTAMDQGGDPPLNAEGRARAEALADFLRDIDVTASVDAIYASIARRTQQTAEPLAKRLGLEIEIADPYDVERFMGRVLREHTGDIVLIVSHSDTIAPLIDELHGHQNLPQIAPDEYDNVYIITISRFGKVKTLRVHYGQPRPALGLSGGGSTTLTAPR
jgi:broad specificity phosphatase PhoE